MDELTALPCRFAAKLIAFDEKRRRELEVGRPLVGSDQLMVLEDFLHISRRRRTNAAALFKLQLWMLQDLVTLERAIAEYKSRRRERESSRDKASDPNATNAELTAIDREIFMLEAELRAIRDIGDGIAWRLFDYDRASLYVLADRPTRGHVELGGLEAELMA